MYESNLARRNLIYIPQKFSTALTHDNHAIGQFCQPGDDFPFLCRRFPQYCVQGGNQGNFQVLCEFDDEAAALTTEYSVFVLQRNCIRIAQVKEIGSKTVIVQLVLADLELHFIRVLIGLGPVVHCNDKTVNVRIVVDNRGRKVVRKRGDTTLSRQVRADKSD